MYRNSYSLLLIFQERGSSFIQKPIDFSIRRSHHRGRKFRGILKHFLNKTWGHFHFLLGRNTLSQKKITLTTDAFSAPVTTKMQLFALLITGKVSVILEEGGFGESVIGATQESFFVRSGWFGNREAVWPSGPIPSKSTSNLGQSLCGKCSFSFDS